MEDAATVSIANAWRSRFDGRLITRAEAEHDVLRRVWNGMIDRRPALIARCLSPADVRTAVKLRAEGLPISVRGGGHSVAGNAVCEGGLMIDLSAMKDIRVDAAAHVAIAGAGVLWGEFDRATQAYGLATTGGQVSHTGIAGLTLGGGLGYLMGKHGATCDNLLSLDVVTADGESVVASADQNPDLFWAMRGAGGNFGVVTSFKYRVHPLSEVFAGMLLYPREQAADLIAFHRQYLKESPDELDTTVAFLNSPEGVPLVAIVAVYAGGAGDGERVLRPLREFGTPVADLIRPMSYVEVQSMLDGAVTIGHRYYWKSNFLADLQPELAAALRDGANAMPSLDDPVDRNQGRDSACSESGDGLRSSRCEFRIVDRRPLDGKSGGRRERAMGSRCLDRCPAVCLGRRRYQPLDGRRDDRSSTGRLRPIKIRTVNDAQGQVRSRQPLSFEPQHSAASVVARRQPSTPWTNRTSWYRIARSRMSGRAPTAPDLPERTSASRGARQVGLGVIFMRRTLAMFVLAVPLAAQEALTLRQAVDLALRSSPLVAAADAGEKEAEARIHQARSGYLPRLQFSESLQRGNNPVFVFSSLLTQHQFSQGNLALGPLNRPDALSNYQSRLSVEQVLFDSRQTSNGVEAARFTRQMAGEETRRSHSDVILDVLRTYFGVQLAEKNLEVARQSRESAQADLERAELIYQSGRSTQADVLAVRVHLAAMREQEIRASNDLAVACAALNDALGVSLDRAFDLTTPLESGAAAPEATLEHYRRLAAEHRPELRQAELAESLARTEAQIAGSAYWPQVVFQGTLEADRQNFSSNGGANWLTAVTLRWNLWTGGETRARVQQARFAESRVEALRKRADSGIQLEVRKAYLDVRAAAQRVEVATAAAAEAEEAHRIIQNRHQAGLTTVTELLRSETALAAARTRRLAAIYDHRVAEAALEHAAGTLAAGTALVN